MPRPSVLGELLQELAQAQTDPKFAAQARGLPTLEQSYPREGVEPVYPEEWLMPGKAGFRKLLGGASSALFPVLSRIGVQPGLEKTASQLTRRGLRGPWFHGTLRSLAEEDPLIAGQYTYPLIKKGFDPSRVGAGSGTRFGEPSGVSLTRHPEVAQSFGQVFRVGVDVPPSSVGQFIDPEFHKAYKRAYNFAAETPSGLRIATRMAGKNPASSAVIPDTPGSVQHFTQPDYLAAGWQVSPPLAFKKLLDPEGLGKGFYLPEIGLYPESTKTFNRALSEFLRAQGVEAIQFSPRRWGEHELRVLEPKKAIPLGALNIENLNLTPALQRYLPSKYRQLEQLHSKAPEYPTRLSDIIPGLRD